MVQLSGGESASYVADLSRRLPPTTILIKAVHVGDGQTATDVKKDIKSFAFAAHAVFVGYALCCGTGRHGKGMIEKEISDVSSSLPRIAPVLFCDVNLNIAFATGREL